MPEVTSVNVGRPYALRLGDRVITTAIWKDPVPGRHAVRGVNVDGDEQADRRVHGGPNKAVYAYALEDTDWWNATMGATLGPGAFGENLSTRGLDVSGALIGERWAIGTTLLEVRQPRIPCFKLGLRMGDPRFPKLFAAANRPGAYLAILEEGELGAGDRIDVVERPERSVTIARFAEIFLRDRDSAGELLELPALPEDWRDWARERVSRSGAWRTSAPS
jgi:MOSC domain-containing protein YiiM